MTEGETASGGGGGVPMSRRAVLRSASLTAALGVSASVRMSAASAESLPSARPSIRSRTAWAGRTCPVRGPLPVESDVRFFLVHHSETGNRYSVAQVPQVLRSFYRYHVAKGWPDIAYNFLVDRYGVIWEGRAGSIGSPILPSASGGSQGFSQIACWIGNHRATAPTAAAQQSMAALLGWLSKRYAVDATPGATVNFVSRGSARWPRGVRVSTRTIEGHRRMSLTDCPGDAAYAIVRDDLPAAVTRLVSR